MQLHKTPFENIPLVTDFKAASGKITISVFESQLRSWVPFFVYLPPSWDCTKEYPLILFFHGQGGDEGTFNKYVQAEQLNNWIEEGEIEPVVIAGVRGDNERDNVQWFTKENESLFIEEKGNEFIQYCKDKFKAGLNKDIAIEGHSRGATGALHYFFKYPGRFSSIVGMGYVSDYTLKDNFLEAEENQLELLKGNTSLRLEIGSEDSFVHGKNRRASYEMHKFLEKKGIEHSFEELHGVEHRFDWFWYHCSGEDMLNGLAHLKFHERSRHK